MYIWIGCKLPELFEQELRKHVIQFSNVLDLSGFSLPQHISLKISFPVADSSVGAVLDCLADLLQSETPFYVNLSAIERKGSILWLRAEGTPRLCNLHDKLDALLLQRFSVPQHPFDRTFQFHSTVCTSDDPEVLERMEQKLSVCAFWGPQKIDTFLLGISPDGTSGSYRVVREIRCL